MDVSVNADSRAYTFRLNPEVFQAADYRVFDAIVDALAKEWVKKNGKDLLAKITVDDVKKTFFARVAQQLSENVKVKIETQNK